MPAIYFVLATILPAVQEGEPSARGEVALFGKRVEALAGENRFGSLNWFRSFADDPVEFLVRPTADGFEVVTDNSDPGFHGEWVRL